MNRRVERLIPQPVAWAVCALRRHPRTTYEAVQSGIGVIVHTCRCGRRQHAEVIPANRHIRRTVS